MADRRLQVFYTVARQLSFTKAAEQLFMTQPAVTFQVKQLEEHFSTRLFERSHGRITLTPAGRLVMDYAEKILGLSDELEKRVAELTGAPAADFTLKVPSFKRFFLVQNATGRIATIDTVAGSTTTPTVPPGGRALLRIAADDDLTVEGLNLYELGFFFGGKPGAGALLARFVFTRTVTWPAGLPLAQGFAGTAPADASQSIDIKRNGTSIGAAHFAQTTGA